MDIGSGRDVQGEELEADNYNKDRWAQALVNKMTAVTTAFRGAGDQRHAARRTYLQMAPDARTESYLEVIDEVLYQSAALNRLTRNARMAVARRAHVVEFLPGEALCVRGCPQDALLVVMSGEVEVVDGHWDGTCPPPPQEFGRFGGLSHEATGYHTATQHHLSQQQQYSVAPPPQPAPSSQYPSRRHLTEQLSVSSGASLASGTGPTPQPPVSPLPLQLDSRHTIHPALQSHSSVHRRHVNNHFKAHGKTSARIEAPRYSGAFGGGEGAHGTAAAAAGSRVVLQRGDSLGAIDIGWLSRVPRSSAAATLEELPVAPSLTSRALLATRAEMASGGSVSGQAALGATGGLAGWGVASIGGSMLRSLAGGPGAGAVGSTGGLGGRRRSSSTGVPALAGAGSSPGAVESGTGGKEAGESRVREEGADRGGSFIAGGHSGGEMAIHGNSSDPLQRLRWPCTAVAVGGRVECAAIGLQQLYAVVATETHWDVEALVESLEELPVFAALSGAELRQLVRVLRLHTFSGGTVIYKQGSVGNDLYIIRSGCVRLLKQVALDDSARNRLNRISAELSAVRDQTAVAAALLHGQQGTSVAPFGSSSGYSPVAGPVGALSSRSSAAASLSGSVSTPASPGRVRRLSHSQGTPGSGGWYGAGGRFSNGPPGSPRGDGLITSVSAAATLQNLLMARGSSPSPASAPVISVRDRTPHRPGRAPSGSDGSSGHGASAPQPPSQQQLASPPRSRPVSGSGPLKGAARRPPEYNVRAHCGGYKDHQHATSAGLGPVDAMSLRRHSTPAPVAPGSPVGHPHVTPQMLAQHAQNRYSPQYGQGGGGGSAEGGGPGTPSQRQHRHRRRSSHVTADELLDRFGVVPRALGERTEALYEDVVMPGSMSGHAPTAAATAAVVATAGQDSGDLPSGSSSDSEGGSGAAPSSPVGLPPVMGLRSSSITQLQGGWAAAAAAAIGGNGSGSPSTALPVWQARAPRQLVQGQELVFVELGVLTAGQCFGEVRSDGVTVRTSSAVCDTRTEVLAISRNELHQRMGGRVFEYLWNQVPNDGPQASMDSATEAGHCAQQLERSMQWTLFKQKLVADVITQKEQRRRTALKCR